MHMYTSTTHSYLGLNQISSLVKLLNSYTYLKYVYAHVLSTTKFLIQADIQ